MRKLRFALGLLLLTPCWVSAAVPQGWFLAGSDPHSYLIDRDTAVNYKGKASGRLESTGESAGFGTMMQTFESGEYLGKRVRMSAFVKSQEVKRWAGLWLRVDGKTRASLSFDNMQNRPITGTTDWKRYEIVLDVPPEAIDIAMGILLDGPGKVWISNVELTVVDSSVPTTSVNPAISPKPANLDFAR
jgi:hypothetical protein